MKNIWKAGMCQRYWKPLLAFSLGVVFCVSAMPAAAQQNQQGDIQNGAPPPDSQDQPQGQPQSTYGSGPMQQQPPYAQQQGPQAQDQTNQPVPPQTLTLPAGTIIRVRVDDWISSDRNIEGDSFGAALDQPIVVSGWVVARRGQAQTGRVSTVKKGGHGTSQLGIELPDLTLVDGQQLPIRTQLSQTSGGSSQGRNAATVGTTTGIGALIGAIAGGGTGAAIGAGIGATAGIAGVMSTPGKLAVISPETVLSFRLQEPVTVSTENSQFAFQPVTQADLDSHAPQSSPRMERRVQSPYYGNPYGYDYPYGYGYPYGWYPTPFIGLGYYGAYGGYRRFGGFRR